MTVRISVIEAAVLLIAVLVVAVGIFRKKAVPPPAAPARLSRLCGLSFFCALLALMAALAAILTSAYAGGASLLHLSEYEVRDLRMISEILRLCALPMAIVALGLAIAGRGAVRESGGALMGRALYRMSSLAALAVGAYICLA